MPAEKIQELKMKYIDEIEPEKERRTGYYRFRMIPARFQVLSSRSTAGSG